MPIIPIHDEKGRLLVPDFFLITFATMLFPGVADQRKRDGFFARIGVQTAVSAGQSPPIDMIACALDAAKHPLAEGGDAAPWRAGQFAGEQLVMLLALSRQAPQHASRNKALFLLDWEMHTQGIDGSEAELNRAWTSHSSVSHLWAAWITRGGLYKFDGYSSSHDAYAMLMEAEHFREFGETHLPDRRDKPILNPDETWRFPPTWRPMKWKPDWPPFGNRIMVREIEPWLMEKLKGYPRDTPPPRKPGRKAKRVKV